VSGKKGGQAYQEGNSRSGAHDANVTHPLATTNTAEAGKAVKHEHDGQLLLAPIRGEVVIASASDRRAASPRIVSEGDLRQV